jgi:hypothetical protein
MMELRNGYIVLIGKPQDKGPQGRLGADKRIILKRILNK